MLPTRPRRCAATRASCMMSRPRTPGYYGQISRSLKRGHGSGRGKKKTCPGTGTSLFKIATLKSAGISRSRAHRAEQLSCIELKEFEEYTAIHTARGRPVSIDEMINTLVRRQQIRPGVGVRPFTNNDEGLFGLEADGSKLSYEGRTYQATKRLSKCGKLKHVLRVLADVPEMHELMASLLNDGQVANLVQHLSQLPIDQHEVALRRLAQKQEAPSAVDFREVTEAANQPEQPCRNRSRASK